MFTIVGYRKITSKKTGEVFFNLYCVKEEDINDPYVTGSSVLEVFVPGSIYDPTKSFAVTDELNTALEVEIYFNEKGRPQKIEEK